MAQTGLESFDRTIQDTHVWLNELMEELHTDDRQRAYQTLKAVLHGLRDRLTPEEAVQLGAQLPMLVRGFYYEGWRLSEVPMRVRGRDEFVEYMRGHLKEVYRQDPGFSVEQAVEAVFRVITRHITAGEIGDVMQQLPRDVLEMWPSEARSGQPGAPGSAPHGQDRPASRAERPGPKELTRARHRCAPLRSPVPTLTRSRCAVRPASGRSAPCSR